MKRRRQPRAYFLAVLADRGYTPDQIRALPLAWIDQVLNHPRDDRGRLRAPAEQASNWPPLEAQRRALLKRGVPAHLVDDLARAAILAANERARGQRKRRR